MAAKTQFVSIPLDEYKELLLKDSPSDKEHELCGRVFEILRKGIEYEPNEDTWSSDYLGNHLRVKRGSECVKEIMTMLRYVDFERYMDIWNSVQTDERNRKAMEARIKQMNEAREMRGETE